MKTIKYIPEFIKARDYLNNVIEEKIEVFLCGIWDPLCSYVIVKETKKIIERELQYLFPKLPKQYLPKCKFIIGNNDIEAGLQSFFNSNIELIYLGHRGINDEEFDLYCKKSYNPYYEYDFIAKYGHLDNEYYEGSKEVNDDYLIGKITPLTLAYELAVMEGLVH